jgi:hypothetical protein
MNRVLRQVGQRLAAFLVKPVDRSQASPPSSRFHLRAALQPGDVLLVEGSSRISIAIKYLTQSTWSHAAMYVGEEALHGRAPSGHCFVEADVVEGVRTVGFEEFDCCHTRICRAKGLSAQESQALVQFVTRRIGNQYDLRNIVDLARYLFPTPPVPSRFRRQLLSLGSGEPTKAICSSLIAEAFESVHFPVIANAHGPAISPNELRVASSLGLQLYKPAHSSLVTPRDFDVSPYFEIIKPTLVSQFNHRDLEWVSDQARP